MMINKASSVIYWSSRACKGYSVMAVLSIIFLMVMLWIELTPGKHFALKGRNMFEVYPNIFTSKNHTGSRLTTRRPKEAPNFDVQYKKICHGNWQTKYSKLHSKALEKSNKYFVFRCSSQGWGNRLRALLSSFHLAMMAKRAFIIDCIKPSPLEKYLEPNYIKWNYKINMTGLTVRFVNPRLETYGTGFKDTDFETYLNYSVEGIHKYYHQFYTTLKENPKYDLPSWPNDYFLLGCSFYFLFKKSQYLEKRLEDARASLGFHENIVLGIHLRRGDDASFGKNTQSDFRIAKVEDTDYYFACADRIEKRIQEIYNTTKIIWFLATDSVEIKKYAKTKYPKKVKQLYGPIEHVGHPRKGNEDIGHLSLFLDYFLLQQSDFRLYSGISTLPFSISIITLGNENATRMSSRKKRKLSCELPPSLKAQRKLKVPV